MSRFEGKVAFITGIARGQGRSHALRLAGEGADIIGCDLCADLETVPYALATPQDLEETRAQIEALGRRAVLLQGDVREPDEMRAVVEAGVSELGRIDIVIANAGIAPMWVEEPDPFAVFVDAVAINLIGVRNSVQAAVPVLFDQGEGGSIILISSTQGLKGTGGTGQGGLDGYAASKHGVVGLMRTWANWLAPRSIRVNSVHPTGVKTPMIENESFGDFLEHSPPETTSALANLLPVDAIDPEDVSAAIAWLASDEARYVTGVALPVDAGFSVR
jgi:SDR family mycofactocin-dependent oxidoreductase